ncbi:hypothetical protein HRbin20_00696 [bacterium HR20]|nr:hypothetical protein HRbin20_00696 [bacterium HR20]
MEILLMVAIAAIALALIALAVWGIRLLRSLEDVATRASTVLRQSEELISTLSRELPSLLRSVEAMSAQATKTLDNADQKLAVLGESLEQFREISRRINTLEQRLQEKIEGPLMDAAKVVAGVTRAVKTFADAINRR